MLFICLPRAFTCWYSFLIALMDLIFILCVFPCPFVYYNPKSQITPLDRLLHNALRSTDMEEETHRKYLQGIPYSIEGSTQGYFRDSSNRSANGERRSKESNTIAGAMETSDEQEDILHIEH